MTDVVAKVTPQFFFYQIDVPPSTFSGAFNVPFVMHTGGKKKLHPEHLVTWCSLSDCKTLLQFTTSSWLGQRSVHEAPKWESYLGKEAAHSRRWYLNWVRNNEPGRDRRRDEMDLKWCSAQPHTAKYLWGPTPGLEFAGSINRNGLNCVDDIIHRID